MSKPINTKLDLFPVAAGVWGLRDLFVNVFLILNEDDNSWVLVDTGLKWTGSKIKRAAKLVFGEHSKPSEIILTHGHFDHIGSVESLAESWDVPVYAHHYEMPYLTGLSSYPPGDPTVRGGLMSDLAALFKRTPINIESRVMALPDDCSVPGLPDWKYIHTPGHSPGHVSLFREKDRLLIAGDAVTTTKAESLWYTALQIKTLSGPPKYFTSDWLSAAASVEELARLEPEIIASGHGKPIRGSKLRKSLYNLSEHFDKLAVPFHGRYIYQPALADDTGVVHIPPKNRNDVSSPTLKIIGATAGILITYLLLSKSGKKRKAKRLQTREDLLLAKYRAELATEAEEAKQHSRQQKKRIRTAVEDQARQVANRSAEVARTVEKQSKPVVKQVKKSSSAFLDNLERLKFKTKRNLIR